MPKAGLEPAHLLQLTPLKRACLPISPLRQENPSVSEREGFGVKFVPRTGLEPAHLAALPPQSSVSTNFTTWALKKLKLSFKGWQK